jgi:preprotein translocase subunit Sec63
MKGRIRTLLVIILYQCLLQLVLCNGNGRSDPYKVLGLAKDSTQDDIKKVCVKIRYAIRLPGIICVRILN